MKTQLPGGLYATDFLARFWQKRPLLVRKALPDLAAGGGIIDRASLFRLAARAEVEARLVWREGRHWRLAHGPLPAARLRSMPERNWTVLVQGVNLHAPAAERLLRRFSFIPHARLDDIMVSYAAPGGGVGPHRDSYDVFLIQASGTRLWKIGRIGRTRNVAQQSLLHGAPLKILRRFTPDEEYLLEPGDLLYLPPGWAHEGTAISAGMTYSVGFRAPAHRELVSEFLQRYAERVDLPGIYADPGLRPQRHAAALPPAMIDRTLVLLSRLRFSRAEVARFLGEYLSEPKARVVFDPPRPGLSSVRFGALLNRTGARLDSRTIMLCNGGDYYVNGERLSPEPPARRALMALADARVLPPGRYGAGLRDILHGWHSAGWLHPGEE